MAKPIVTTAAASMHSATNWAFIEEQEEGDEDVTDIIGDVDDKEET